jgi:hypothetical protein
MPPADVAACPSCGKPIEPRPRRRRKCPHCREWVAPGADRLLGDAQARPPNTTPAAQADAPQAEPKEKDARPEDGDREVARFADFKMFRSNLSPWEAVFREAADFATRVGPGRVISISHSEENNEAVVTVWFWREALEVESSGP